MVRGSWFVVRGSWFVVRGSWFVVRGSWFVVRGARESQETSSTTASGMAVSSERIQRFPGGVSRRICAITRQASVANTPLTSTTSALTRYTPPTRAGVRKSGTGTSAVPRKFHAKPVNSHPRNHSIPAQRTGSNARPHRPNRRQARADSQPKSAK